MISNVRSYVFGKVTRGGGATAVVVAGKSQRHSVMAICLVLIILESQKQWIESWFIWEAFIFTRHLLLG